MKTLLGILFLLLMLACLGCGSSNAGASLPAIDEAPASGATPSGSTLEMYYWTGEADPAG